MTDEPDTAPSDEDVTDNVELSDDDTSDDLDYYDPDEDQDTVEAEEADETDDEADETEAEDEAEGQEAEDQTEEDPDSVTVTMDDGNQLPLGELKKGYLRQSDYTRKAQELSNTRSTLEADTQRMQQITEAFVDYMTTLIPDAPDASLALSDAAAYTAQKAQHEASMAQVQKLIELGEAPKEIAGKMSAEDVQRQMQEANSKLVEMFPEMTNGEGRKQFFDGVANVATDLGFSKAELGQISDPRIFALAHWAQKGMAGEQAKAKVKAKIAKAPPATPRKKGQGARKADGNVAAMRKLDRTGSLEDALAVDFD